jgi:integrase
MTPVYWIQRDAGVSVPTTRKIITTVKAMLQYAVGRDLVAVNAAKAITVIGRRDEGSKKIMPPAKEVVTALLSVADPDFRVKLMFAALGGVRAGELHALKGHHISFERREVKIETRVAHQEEHVTKTAAGMRTVPLAAPLILALKEWQLRSKLILALKEWQLRSKWKKPNHLVFPSHRGWYVDHANMVKRKFLPLFERLAKLHAEDPANHPEPPARFNWNALRHFAVSCWIEAGLAPTTVQTFAGHSTLAVTRDSYGHLFKSDDHRKAMDAIAGDVLG